DRTRRVARRESVAEEEAVEHPDRRQVPRLRARREPRLLQLGEMGGDVLGPDRIRLPHALAVEEVEVALQVGAVGVHGLGAQPALDANVGEEEIEQGLERAVAGHGPILAPPGPIAAPAPVDRRDGTGQKGSLPLPSRRTSIWSSSRETTVDGSKTWKPPSTINASACPRRSLMVRGSLSGSPSKVAEVVNSGCPSPWTSAWGMAASGMRMPTVFCRVIAISGVSGVAGRMNVKGPGTNRFIVR